MSRKVKKTLIIFLLFVFFIFFAKAVRMVRNSVWDGVHHIDIAVDNGDLEIWSIEPSKGTAAFVLIPKDAILSLPEYGNYKAGSVGKLSLLEKKNGELVRGGLMQTLAIPIDATIIPKEGKEKRISLKEFFGLQGFSRVFGGSILGTDYVTNLSFLDLFRLWLFSFSLKEEAIEKVEITNVTTKTSLPDGGESLTIDRDRFSTLATRYFTDLGIEKEQQTIEVLNGSDTQGKAIVLSLILQNIGGNVINTGKSENQQGQSTVFAKKSSYTATKIAQIVGGSLSNSPQKETRADILVILGGK